MAPRRPRWQGLAVALLAPVVLAALPMHAPAEVLAQGPELRLRLADGTVVRIACGTSCSDRGHVEPAWLSTSPRRAPLKRSPALFEARQPGVVASVRS